MKYELTQKSTKAASMITSTHLTESIDDHPYWLAKEPQNPWQTEDFVFLKLIGFYYKFYLSCYFYDKYNI